MTAKGLTLYPEQEEAILELFAGRNVVLNTPTGSGKSLVAAALHFKALCAGQRSVYTCPIKALVNEKFLSLCRDFGPENVGMMTGDASVNPKAPILCCTAEILANIALTRGDHAEVGAVIMDEFHYYSDIERGYAWQVPLLTLPQSRFLLMSATLGSTDFFERELTRLTGAPSVTVRSDRRPVPLSFEYSETPLPERVTQLLADKRAPIYLVHFTQRAAAEAAQALMSLPICTKEEKAVLATELERVKFNSPYGKDMKRWLRHGIGVHHAGLLPKYRILVEQLAQKGLLKLICGTDTLGVGINVPIRTVVFTQLWKYDGQKAAILSVRDFRQVSGRAGRAGYDDQGYVIVQAPEHMIENKIAQQKATGDAKKMRKWKPSKPPERGYAHWSQDTFDKMVSGEPEPLRSHFRVNHQMVMSLLDRPSRDGVDGCRAVRTLMTDNHESRKRQRGHIRRTIAIYRSLVEAEMLEFPEHPDEWGRRVRVNFDLQDEFALHQPLSLWAVEALGALPPRDNGDPDGQDDGAAIEHVFDVLSIIESVQENPGVILAAQTKRAKDELMAEMKSSGVEYEERIERLSQVEHPRPNREWIYGNFNEFRARHPWVGSDNVAPKSIVREMFERAMTFGEYVQDYGLKRSEGVVLRYLSDVYKALLQNVPEDLRTPALEDLTVWLGAMIRQVDSSLIDEWERLLHPDDSDPAAALRPTLPTGERTIVDDHRAFRVMVRNKVFDWVQRLARRNGYDDLVAEAVDTERWRSGEDIIEAMAAYRDEFGDVLVDPAARSGELFHFDRSTGRVTQILHDPEDSGEWRIVADVDLDASRDENRVVLRLVDLGPLR